MEKATEGNPHDAEWPSVQIGPGRFGGLGVERARLAQLLTHYLVKKSQAPRTVGREPLRLRKNWASSAARTNRRRACLLSPRLLTPSPMSPMIRKMPAKIPLAVYGGDRQGGVLSRSFRRNFEVTQISSRGSFSTACPMASSLP